MIAQIGPLAELVAAEALRHLAAVIRKKEDRQEAADRSRSKTRNQRWIDFLRSTTGPHKYKARLRRSEVLDQRFRYQISVHIVVSDIGYKIYVN